MAVYNEAATVEAAVIAILAQPSVKEIVVVDDASTDGSADIVSRLAASKSTIVLATHDRNRGKGAALRTGFALVNSPIVIIHDADLEYDARDYPRLLTPILEGRADVVFGSRFIGSDAHRVLYFWHSIANRLLTTLCNAFSNLNLTDMETCMKAFRRESLVGITFTEDRFTFEPEFTIKVARAGLRVYEVAVSYHGRTYAEGKKIKARDGLDAIRAILVHGFKL
jgi:glycosyltransferase involved in cell wall biosynthesis